MIDTILSIIGGSGIWAYVAGAVAVLLGLLGVRRSGVQAERGRQAKKDLEAAQRGVQGAARAKKDLKDKTPADIVRENDGAWDQ